MAKVKLRENEYLVDKKIDNWRLYNRYKLLALNMFRWENLPMGIESKNIERILYENGQGVFYKNKDYGYVFLPCNGVGTPNVMNEDVYVRTSGYMVTDTLRLINSTDSFVDMDYSDIGVRCLNNDLKIPSYINVIDYANKMNEVEKAIDLNISQQKFPYLIMTNTNTEFSMKTLMDKVNKGEPCIYIDKKLGIGDLQFFNTGVPFVVDKLQQYKKDLEQEILNYFGLSSTNDKRERMLVDELNLNNDYKDRTCELMFKQRKLFCELVNKTYGLNIKVINLNEEKENVSRETIEGCEE